MSIFLKDIPLPQAYEKFSQAITEAGLNGPLGTETIPLTEHAVGRVLSEPAWAKICSPHYHSAAMDGFAIHSQMVSKAQPDKPVTLLVTAQAKYVDTGDPLPDGTDSVIPIEQVEPLDDDGHPANNPRKPTAILVRASNTPWSHVRQMGEDMIATQLVLSSGHMLRPVDLGALAACGHTDVRVIKIPSIAVIPTGTELIPVGPAPKAGDIIEFNSMVLAAQVNGWGGMAKRYPIVRDDYDLIREAVIHAAQEADMVLLNAGSSAGAEDFSARIVEDLGEILVHGVAVRPGHPVILGMLTNPLNPARKVPIIGVPGYPVSAALTGELFVEPWIKTWSGKPPAQVEKVDAILSQKVNSPAGDDDYLRVVVARVGKELLAAPLPRGAGVINSLVKADGIVVIPRGVQGLESSSKVSVALYRRPDVLERTLLISGSHDLSLDILADEMSRNDIRVVTSNNGSLGGLLALKRGEAHAAGSHLLDPKTGEYNLLYIRNYLPETSVRLIHWVKRVQGLIVLPGNPKRIQSINDLVRQDVTFVNRQRGAGTRVLLDYQLEQAGYLAGQVNGYQQEEYTHLAVAAAVSSGRADCGLGIAAAAQALGLDFIPLFDEQYDLVIPESMMDSDMMEQVLVTARTARFRARVESMPGYVASQMGNPAN